MLNKLFKQFKDGYFLGHLLIVIVLFVVKSAHFSLPYFGDELWAYGPAVRKLAILGPSSIGVYDYWGHPMLLFWLHAAWAFLFGTSIFSTHVFSAIISSLFLSVLFYVGSRLINKLIGLLAVVVVASQSIFLGQYNLVLPEVLLALFTLLSVLFYIEKKRVFFLIATSAMVLTKESGVFVIASIGLWHILKSFIYDRDKLKVKALVVDLTVIAAPLLVILLHFCYLKWQYGWFVMPNRTADINTSWDYFQERIMGMFHYLFIDQGRRWLTISLFFIGILFYINYSWLKRISLIAISFSFSKVFYRYWKVPTFIEYTILPVVYVVVLKLLFFDVYKKDKKEGDLIGIAVILISSFGLFLSSYFDSKRYVFLLVPLIILLFLYFINQLPKSKIVAPVLAIAVSGMSLFYLSTDMSSGDDTWYYGNHCQVVKQTVEFVEDQHEQNDRIYATFLMQNALLRPLSGYLSTSKGFSNVKPMAISKLNNKEALFIFSEKETPDFYFDSSIMSKLALVKRFEKGSNWVEIYKSK